jgi:hypothetical protein
MCQFETAPKKRYRFLGPPGTPSVEATKSTCAGSETKPMVMTNIAMVFRWPIETDGLPFLNMVDLSMANCECHNQMVIITE